MEWVEELTGDVGRGDRSHQDGVRKEREVYHVGRRNGQEGKGRNMRIKVGFER